MDTLKYLLVDREFENDSCFKEIEKQPDGLAKCYIISKFTYASIPKNGYIDKNLATLSKETGILYPILKGAFEAGEKVGLVKKVAGGIYKMTAVEKYGVSDNIKLDNDLFHQNFWHDLSLSCKSRYIMAYLLLAGGDMVLSCTKISEMTGIDRQAVNRGLQELELHGYLEREAFRDVKGKFVKRRYKFIYRPIPEISMK